MKKFSGLILCALSLSIIGCTDGPPVVDDDGPKPAPLLSHSIISMHPHDTSYFTQGYEFYNNTLLIGTGNYGYSKLLQADPATGKVLKEVVLDPKEFGEGITVLNDTVYQLTWKEHVVHLYDAKTLHKIKDLPLNGEGWGMTNDGKEIIVSNGTNNLYFYEPASFKLVKVLPVTDAGAPAVNLNELEYANGSLYANQWQYHHILKIDPSTGQVAGKYDFSDLVTRVQADYPYLNTRTHAVLNGIAYHAETKRFFITGKSWPKAYEVDLAP